MSPSLIWYWRNAAAVAAIAAAVAPSVSGQLNKMTHTPQSQGQMKDMPPLTRCMLQCISGVANSDVIKQHLFALLLLLLQLQQD